MFKCLNLWWTSHCPPVPPPVCNHVFPATFFTGSETKVTCSKCGYSLIVSASMFGQVHVQEAR